jgi:IS5 family transposase
MTHFRKRLNFSIISSVNESITGQGKKSDGTEKLSSLVPGVNEGTAEQEKESKDDDKDGDLPKGGTPPREPDNKGKLILDATCAPADIEYPTDLNLLKPSTRKTGCHH